MAITIQTDSGNFYTYQRNSNEIVEGIQEENMSSLVFKERDFISCFPELSIFTLGITTRCNLRCLYCCYSGAYRNTRTHGKYSMLSKDVLPVISFINRYATQQPITLSFYGGESLLEFDLIKEFVFQARKEWCANVQFEISTNGVLLTPVVIEWLVANNITLFLSLDGTIRVQNRQRKTAGGTGSFAPIMEALRYIRSHYLDYFLKKVHLLMTVVEVSEIPQIAEEWYNDNLLKDKLPIRISTVAPNYRQGVQKIEKDECIATYLEIVDEYQKHPEYTLLKVFFERFLAEWINRPIFELKSPSYCPTCMPLNQKIYIDTDGKVGICEKVPDAYRIGNIHCGIDWQEVNRQTELLSKRIKSHCMECSVVRLCSVCPQVLDLSDAEMDIFCHNERIMQQVKFRIFCELAERGMI